MSKPIDPKYDIARMAAHDFRLAAEQIAGLAAEAHDRLCSNPNADTALRHLEQAGDLVADIATLHRFAMANTERVASVRGRPPALSEEKTRTLTYYGPDNIGMRALTLWQPWAWAMAQGFKVIENRDWAPPKWLIGHDFALHAGAKWDSSGAATVTEILSPAERNMMPDREDINSMAIVAVATLKKVYESADDIKRELGDYEAKFFFGPYGWHLTNIRPLMRPIGVPGHQKLWRLPEPVEWQVRNQLDDD